MQMIYNVLTAHYSLCSRVLVLNISKHCLEGSAGTTELEEQIHYLFSTELRNILQYIVAILYISANSGEHMSMMY